MSKYHNYYTIKGFELHSTPDSLFFFFITSLVLLVHNQSCYTVFNLPLNHLLIQIVLAMQCYNSCHINGLCLLPRTKTVIYTFSE